MIENLCETVLTVVVCHMALGKSLQEDFSEKDYIRLQKLLEGMEEERVKEQFHHALEELLKKLPGDSGPLMEYLNKAIIEIAVRVKYHVSFALNLP